MANNLTDDGERILLDLLTGVSAEVPVLPIVVRLMSANGSESAAGTEIVGDSYEEKPITFAAAVTVSGTTTAKNSVLVGWTMLDSTATRSVTGYEIWDSGVVPRRFVFEAYGSPVSVGIAEPVQIVVNALSLGLE